MSGTIQLFVELSYNTTLLQPRKKFIDKKNATTYYVMPSVNKEEENKSQKKEDPLGVRIA